MLHRLTVTHKKLEELEDPLVCENIKCVPRDGVDDRQAVNFVFDEGVHCIKQAATQQMQKASYSEDKKSDCIHTKTDRFIIYSQVPHLASGDMLTKGLNVDGR